MIRIGRNIRLVAGLGAALLLTAAGYGGYRWHAASVSTTILASISSAQSSTLDLGTAAYSPNLSYREAMADGTGNDQFKIIYADSGTIAASDSVLLDLAGSQTDAFGATITCATLKGLMVTAKATNTNDVMVGGAKVAAVNFLGVAAGDTLNFVPVKPGGVFLWMSPRTGVTVTGGSRDIVRLKNSAGTSGVGYSIQALCR